MAYTDIDKPSDYFNTLLYTGNGGTQSITGVGFTQDFTWIKSRSTAQNHYAFDTVRGAQKQLYPSTNSSEDTGQSNGLNAFTSDGFNLGTEVGVNGNGATFASWNWKKVAGVFDIQTYAGNNSGSRTIAHNLGVVPSLIIVKNRTNNADWFGGSTTPGVSFNWATDYFRLNENAAKGTDSGGNLFGAVPTDSVFTPGTNNDMNGSNNNYVAYLFGNKQGVSKVGSYVGNGNADGTFVYLGFKPAWVMVKRSDGGTENWQINDNKRKTFNVNSTSLFSNTNGTESTDGMYIDMLSNGFKARETGGGTNGSGSSYLYMAFAENPFVTSTGIPAAAR